MKKLLAILLVLAVALAAAPTVGASYSLPDDLTLHAKSAMLVYIDSSIEKDHIVFERDADTRRDPAATLRVMVGLYAIRLIREKNIDMDTVTGVYDMTCYNQVTGTGLGVVGMYLGNTWTLRDLLAASMAETAADACVVMCQTLAGSTAAFVDGMNALAAEIGCTNTHFQNVTGLTAEGQYTTARDLYRITRAAMEYPELTAMLGAPSYEVTPVVGRKQVRATTTFMLRSSAESYYKYLQFGRAGSTENEGRNMVGLAKNGGYQYMAVVLGSEMPDGQDSAIVHFEDAHDLFDWGFFHFSYRTLLSAGQPVGQLKVELAWSTDTVVLAAGSAFGAVVPDDTALSEVEIRPVLSGDGRVDAPVKKGDVFGTAEIWIVGGDKIGEVPMVAADSVSRSTLLAITRGFKRVFTSKWLYIAIGLFCLLAAGYVLLSALQNRKRRKKR